MTCPESEQPILRSKPPSVASPMSSPDEAHNEFNHQVAIKLSRALNTLNPNDLLAQRVIDIAKTNSENGFIAGMLQLPKFTT